MKRTLLYALFFFVAIGAGFSQIKNEGSPVLDSIAKSIRSKENLGIDWETSFKYGKERVDDIHSAKIKGSKYTHQNKNIIIICNGELVSREYKDSKKKILSHCDTTVNYNPINVLTFFGSGYRINHIKKNRSSKMQSIRIETIDDKANLIKEAFLYFDQAGVLSSIKFKTKRKFVNYVKINRLDSTTPLKDSDFEIVK